MQVTDINLIPCRIFVEADGCRVAGLTVLLWKVLSPKLRHTHYLLKLEPAKSA